MPAICWRRRATLLAVLLGAGAAALFPGTLAAEPYRSIRNNFQLELPDDWTPVDPLPRQAVVAMQSPDGKRTAILLVSPLTSGERRRGVQNVISGLKESIMTQGFTIGADSAYTLGGLPFLGFSATKGEASLAARSVGAGEFLYLIQLIHSAGDADVDPDLQAIASSFQLLEPRPVYGVESPEQSRLGKAAVAAVGMAAVGLAIHLLRKRRRKAEREAKAG